MALSQPMRREKKSARFNPVKTATVTSKFSTQSVIETIAYKDKEVIYLYIDAWIRKQKIFRIFADFSIMVKLINRKVVQNLDFSFFI